MKKVLTVFAVIIFAVLLVAVFFFLFAGFIYLAWNFVIAAAFGLPTLTFFQSCAVGLICEIISGITCRKVIYKNK